MTVTSPVPPYPEPRGLLKGKTVVVTAAAGTGIGFSAAQRAAEEGATLLISDFHERRLGEAADRIAEKLGVRPATFVCDVSSEEQVQGLRDAALSTVGRVDVLINNAGLGGEVDVVDMTDEQWSRVIDVTLTSLFRMTRAFLPSMYAAKSGVMVNNASVLGWRAQKGQAHYAAAKAGVMAFTRCSALEAAEHNVRINAVSPSLAMHPFLAKVTTQEALDKLVEREAFGRPAEVWEIANVMMFLASDLSSYMTGEIVSVSSQRA
jgi:3-oxoacyl-[acyl-carrier protein] reductase